MTHWKAVDALIGEQKFQAALDLTLGHLERARAAKDEADWARALIRATQLQTALHGYETSVRFLREQPWPEGALHRATLDLFYARSLVTYVQAYQWEIRQRERVESKGEVDLKRWTVEQLYTEAQRAYDDVWRQREALGGYEVEALGEYLHPNDYPREVRGTLRDAVTYLRVELLADTTGWRPEQQNESFRVALEPLLRANAKWAEGVALSDPAVHPLERIGAALMDLELWHAKEERPEAALEAKLERLRRLHDAFEDKDRRALIRAELERTLPDFRKRAWWAMGAAQLATFQRDAGMLVRARETAQDCVEAYPEAIGGQRCRHLVAALEVPYFAVTAMSHDALGKRSVEVTHKNLPKLYFRAYAIDLEKRLRSARDYNLLPSGDEMRALLEARADASWTVDLPPTPDLQPHRTFVTPPLTKRGAFLLLASAREDFAATDNLVVGTHVIVTGLAVTTRSYSDGTTEVSALEAETGAPAVGVELSLWRFDWQRGHQPVETRRTDKSGSVQFTSGKGDRRGHGHFVVGKRGAELVLDPNGLNFWNPSPQPSRKQALIYTDRSIYRTLQKVMWKVIAFEGSPEGPSYKVMPSADVSVSLLDANGQVVEQKKVRANAWGSASGEFDLPTGRLLGQWRLRTEPNGYAAIRVEEYKRPTFTAELKDPEGALRLNKPAEFRGEARYYFGLPVTSGQVRWRVTREPRWPWWWGYWGMRPPASQSQVVATGSSALDEEGSFKVAFTPEAEEPKTETDRQISWSFRVSADITDEGGETRSAERVFRLGWVSVEGRVEPTEKFFGPNVAPVFDLVRTDLNGVGRAGKASWRIVEVKQPDVAPMPADVPVFEGEVLEGSEAPQGDTPGELPEGQPKVVTPGDRLRPRWGGESRLDAIASRWADGAERAKGEVTHDAKGAAQVAQDAGKLAPGLYRFHYETTDDFGAKFTTQRLFVIAGEKTRLQVPLHLVLDKGSARAGDKVTALVTSGVPGQRIVFDVYRAGRRVSRQERVAGESAALITLPIGKEDRGGFSVSATVMRDHQLVTFTEDVFVPWDDRELKIEFATFRDKLRPGSKETFRVTVSPSRKGEAAVGASELLAYMYDEALDLFAPHSPPSVMGLYPTRTGAPWMRSSLGAAQTQWVHSEGFGELPDFPSLSPDYLLFHDNYGVGGPGMRYRTFGGTRGMPMPAPSAAAPMEVAELQTARRSRSISMDSMALEESEGAPGAKAPMKKEAAANALGGEGDLEQKAAAPEVQLRQDFSETAFFAPHLLTNSDGSATIEFTVPDSVTSWNVWVHAVTKDLRGGSATKKTRSVKDLMVRPYVPRFLREGDTATLTVNVNNASEGPLKGELELDLIDVETQKSVLREFGLDPQKARASFDAKAGGGATVGFPIVTPARPGQVAVKVTARSGSLSDGELRPIPVLPGRLHLAQSRFVTLREAGAKKTLSFEDMAQVAKGADPSLTHDQLVVTIDAQLFYTALGALPYLINYPYECTEQTLNRFVSTGILSSLYGQYPAVAKMAKQLSERDTPLETWDSADPNRKMAMEETPWVVMGKGGSDGGHGLTNVLDPKIAKAERDASLAKLRKAQTANGAFPWFPGGPPSPYMTLYILHGFARAADHGVEIPRDMVQRAWAYVAQHYRDEYAGRMLKEDCCWEFLTFLNYVASSYKDASYTGNALTVEERKQILEHSFKHWKSHSPYLKGYLALTLQRMDRAKDAKLVWASVMDSAKTTEEEGTHWAAEDRSWLWYNDRIETHAFALQVLMQLEPDDARRHGLVQWLLINKKLNHWKSTRATAEVVYALVKYLEKEKGLGVREEVNVEVGPRKVQMVFQPDQFTGKKNQVVIPGAEVDAKTMSRITVTKPTKGFAFASATWHFATDKLPEEARGDFFSVSRRYYKRERTGREAVLKPLEEGAKLEVGDELEVHLSIRSKHAAEYVHLRDPRAAGLEPESPVSRYKWDMGLVFYEETRDSGANFFFEWLPQGEWTFKYRLRANMAGEFRVGPATLQSMYAPEFNAYSAGHRLKVEGK